MQLQPFTSSVQLVATRPCEATAICIADIQLESLQWAKNVHNILNQSGVSSRWDTPMHSDANFLVKEIHQDLCDQFIQEWSSSLELTTGKLRTYRICKTQFRREKYLELPSHLRSAVKKLRLSCHPLRIETGRYHRPNVIPIEERKCIFCKENSVEDEFHVVFCCTAYKDLPEYKLPYHCLITIIIISFQEKWRLLWTKVKWK